MKHSISKAENAMAFHVLSALFLLSCLLVGWSGPIGKYSLSLPWPFETAVPSGYFILLFASQWVLCMGLLLVVPRAFSAKQKLLFIFFLALAARLCMLPHEPSDDMNRYLWEGRMLTQGINPYRHAPDDALLEPLAADDPFHGGINHPHMTAAYPPMMVGIFFAGPFFLVSSFMHQGNAAGI